MEQESKTMSNFASYMDQQVVIWDTPQNIRKELEKREEIKCRDIKSLVKAVSDAYLLSGALMGAGTILTFTTWGELAMTGPATTILVGWIIRHKAKKKMNSLF